MWFVQGKAIDLSILRQYPAMGIFLIYLFGKNLMGEI